MTPPRKLLEKRLNTIQGIHIDTWKDTELVCVFYEGKELGHFHGETILDLRLSQKIIRNRNISRDISKKIHPNRSANSIWVGIEFNNEEDVDRVVELIDLVISNR